MRRAGRNQSIIELYHPGRGQCSRCPIDTVNRSAILTTIIVISIQIFQSYTVKATPDVQSDFGSFGYKMISTDLSSPATGDPIAINKVVHELGSNGLAVTVDRVDLDTLRESRSLPLITNETKNNNYNKTTDILPSGQPQVTPVSNLEEISNNDTSLQLSKPAGKIRRQVLQKQRVSDWWTELLIKNKLHESTTKSRTNAPPIRTDVQPNEYREQPLSQNAVLTFRNQLIAIRDKHKLLLTRAVPQLQQLDQKLIDSYKLLMKRKMPLYGGMLYRSRDFVVRMVNEVKHERQVLEAMAKQVQKVLKDRMANKTLIKDYNKAASSNGADLDRLTSLPLVELSQQIDEELEISNKQSEALKVAPLTGQSSNDNKLGVPTASPNYVKTSPKKGKHNKSQWKSEEMVQKNYDYDSEETDSATKPPKQIKYTVHINEVNLKRELSKTQALIDRVNGSYHELSSVIEDILYLFKLTSDPKRGLSSSGKTTKMDRVHGGNQMLSSELSSMSPEQQRKLRKMLKSPIRLYLERYGKLQNGLTWRSNNSTTSLQSMRLVNQTSAETAVPFEYPADVKPLFEPAFSESSTLNLGSSLNDSSPGNPYRK